uniref:Putative anti-sigma-factor antagonist n=1 Tax=Magnetococcus massalia (strain MO-1) TaxID=451514 RepID=A0A1S7LMD2_MAGMO|nr:putative anti-sigma-factor antagonist [Candidatus Magnetococcus massalia]
MLTIEQEIEEEAIKIMLQGRFDVTSSDKFQGLYSDHPPGLIYKVYLEKVTFMDSAAFGFLHGLKHHAGKYGEVYLYNPAGDVVDILRTMGAYQTFNVIVENQQIPDIGHDDGMGF